MRTPAIPERRTLSSAPGTAPSSAPATAAASAPDGAPANTPATVAELRHRLLAHYDRTKRDLPWRGQADPYRTLVSEMMLQQTRVETVLRYYDRWMERFPDLESLARAEEPEVLRVWEGLGYYRRARSLHAAARLVREEHGGRIPEDPEALRRLPGIGAYTAGAVASIAFRRPVGAVDGNVRRVLARWVGERNPSTRTLQGWAQALVDPDRPGDWNQALMDLGATLCTPRAPRCERCPVGDLCVARVAGEPETYPAPAERRPPRRAIIALAVLSGPGGSVLLERRTGVGLLEGMWGFPEREVSTAEESRDAVIALAEELLGVARSRGAGGWDPPRELPLVRHRFSHLDVGYLPWILELPRPAPPRPDPVRSRVLEWVSPDGWGDLPIPVAQRRVLEAASEARRMPPPRS